MHVIDLSDTPYEGRIAQYGHNGSKTARELRGKYKANKRAPRGLYSSTRSGSKASKAAPVTVVKPSLSYQDRIAKFGAIGNVE